MPPAPSGTALRVILAASDSSERDRVALLLGRGQGGPWEVVHAGTAALALEEAMAPADPCPCERVLLAGRLEGMEPLRLLARLGAEGGTTPCPVVMLVEGSGRELGPALLRAGAHDYIATDWTGPDGLARSVDNALARWAREQDLRRQAANVLSGQSSLVREAGSPYAGAHAAPAAGDPARAQARVDELLQANHRKDEFLAILAHELRNPLAPIRNGLEILRRGGRLEGPAAQAREMMERQLAHMVRLVDDLLDVSRISRGKVDLRLAPLQVQAVLEHALEACQPAIDHAGHTLLLKVPGQPLPIVGDLTRLAQVVGNLLNNAAKYTPAGGRIELAASTEGRQAVIQVRDNGTGISADMLPRVFDLFAQVDRTLARSQGGLGIGLSLARQLVGLHGGEIVAESAGPGRGSCFTIRLPLAGQADTPVVPAVPLASGPPRLAAMGAAARILVVDDNIDGADSLALMLGLLGHEVRTAHDGPAALEVAGQWRPEVVLLDIGLPGMSGYEVARCLRAHPVARDLVLVAVTGWGTEEDRRRSAEAGFDHHLTKPVEATALEEVLARPRSC